MPRRSRDVSDEVQKAAASAWRKWSAKLATVPAAPHNGEDHFAAAHIDPNASKTPEERMVAKIRQRMKEYPEWYETDEDKVAALVVTELERIGGILERTLPETEEAVPVWEVPLSVFNWLVESAKGDQFVHGALSAWSRALHFNAANSDQVGAQERAELRAPFLEIAPPLLKAVLAQMLKEDLWISFAQKFVGPELKYLEMRVQRPTQHNGH